MNRAFWVILTSEFILAGFCLCLHVSLQSMNRIKSVIFLVASVLVACSGGYQDFQADADIIRLQHMEYYGKLFMEYHDKTGTYPLVGEVDVPGYVFVASPEQTDDISGGPSYEHVTADFRYLIEELEKGLGRPVAEYYDPQFEPDAKPNFYIYMVDGETFNFAVHTHEAFSFANAVAPGYNKVEITNNTNGAVHLITPQELFDNPEFRAAVDRPISKPAFFKEREERFICAVKCGNEEP